MATDDELLAWLEEDDALRRAERVERLRLVREAYGPEGIRMFPGGPVSAQAFEEAKSAYVHGLFVSCIIMCQVCLEQMLGGLFRLALREDLRRGGAAIVLAEARRAGFITEAEFALFDRLRKVRNPYAHYLDPEDAKSLLYREGESGTLFDDFAAKDAERAIVALLRLCQRPPFALVPLSPHMSAEQWADWHAKWRVFLRGREFDELRVTLALSLKGWLKEWELRHTQDGGRGADAS
jgi:hypothetical protein